MRKVILGICAVIGVFYVINHIGSTVSFGSAPPVVRVEHADGSSGTVVPRSSRYLAVYHGAGWCPPCQQFSPHLADFYRNADKTKGWFHLFMVNYDRSEADMLAYMRQHRMEFPAVMRGDAGGWGASTGRGIPNLIIIDTATGKVLSSSYDGSSYVGCDPPLQVLEAIATQGHP